MILNLFFVFESVVFISSTDSTNCKDFFLPDSVIKIIQNQNITSNTSLTCIEFIDDRNKPFATPNLMISVIEKQKISISLFNDEKKFIYLLMSEKTEKGEYRVYFNNDFILKSIKDIKKPIYILVMQGESCRAYKTFLVK